MNFILRIFLMSLTLLFFSVMMEKKGWSWKAQVFPVREEVKITSTFGESRGDHFHNGIDFAGVQKVYPIVDAVLLFYLDQDEYDVDRPIGVGNVVVLQHRDQVRSYYYHLERGSVYKAVSSFQKSKEVTLSTNTALGVVGNSGYSMGAHLHYALEEVNRTNLNNLDHTNLDHDYSSRLVNPLKYLPDIRDSKKPFIYSAFTVHNQRGYRLYHSKRYQLGVDFNLHVSTWDLKHYFNPSFRPHLGNSYGVDFLRFSLDGQTLRSYNFSYLDKTKTGLTLSGYYFEDVYLQKHSYKLGKFTPTNKQHNLEFVSRDWNGNETIKNLTLYFVKPRRRVARRR